MYSDFDFRSPTEKLADWFPLVVILVIGLIILGVVAALIYFFVKKQDNGKELVTRRVKILEKPIKQGNIEWYVVECENGERLKLRSFQANSIFISVGDEGIMSYKGKTVQSFRRG